MDYTIKFMLHNNGGLIKPGSHLKKNMFERYAYALDKYGCHYDKKLGGCLVSFYLSVPLAKELRKLGFRLKSESSFIESVTDFYTWLRESSKGVGKCIEKVNNTVKPKGWYVFNHQVEAAKFIAKRQGALLCDEMGIGKSLSAILAIPENVPVLVICPAIAIGVWQREFDLWRPGEFTSRVVRGKNNFSFPEAGEVVVVSYDSLPDVLKSRSKFVRDRFLSDCPDEIVIICDESHKVKSLQAQRSKKVKYLCEYARDVFGKTWLLTGTPILNNAKELWSQLQIAGLEKEAYGDWNNFYFLFRGSAFGAWGLPRPEALKHLKTVMLRRLAKDVQDLPETRTQEIPVTIDAKTRRIVDKFYKKLRELKIPIEEAIKHAQDKKHPLFKEIARIRMLLAMAKIPSMLEIVDEYEEYGLPAIVCCSHVKPIELLGHRKGWAIITGATPEKTRKKIEEDFQAGKYKGVGMTIKAGGMAITLHRACHMLMVDMEWTPGLNEQARKRIHRQGQKNNCFYKVCVVDHPLETKVYECLTRKQTLVDMVDETFSKGGK